MCKTQVKQMYLRTRAWLMIYDNIFLLSCFLPSFLVLPSSFILLEQTACVITTNKCKVMTDQ